MTTRLLAISGSLRAESSNTTLLRAAALLASSDVEVTFFTGLADLPHFNPDLDGPEPFPAVATLRAAVETADALLISSPEYAHGVPGALKNALDWLVSGVEICDKPVALLNASPRATHAQASLKETLVTMCAAVIPSASLDIPLAGRRLDAARIVADPELALLLRAALDELVRAAQLFRERA